MKKIWLYGFMIVVMSSLYGADYKDYYLDNNTKDLANVHISCAEKTQTLAIPANITAQLRVSDCNGTPTVTITALGNFKGFLPANQTLNTYNKFYIENAHKVQFVSD